MVLSSSPVAENKMSVSVPSLIAKEIDSTQMTKMVKILAQIISQPIRKVFSCKLHILKFQISVHKKKPKFVCYSIREVKGDEIRNYLKLFVLRKKRISFKTLGKVEPIIKTVDIVQLKVLRQSKSVVIEAMCKPFIYSDILSQNVPSVAYEITKKCLAEASFKLHKWATNRYGLAKLIKLDESDTTEMRDVDDKTYVKDSLGIIDTYRKVLRVNWNTTADKFIFEFSDIINIA